MNTLKNLINQAVGGYGTRPDDTFKGEGWFGPLINAQGDVVTELSGESDGLLYPLVNPYQSFKTLSEILMMPPGGKLSDEVWDNAYRWAIDRGRQGKRAFAPDPLGGD